MSMVDSADNINYEKKALGMALDHDVLSKPLALNTENEKLKEY